MSYLNDYEVNATNIPLFNCSKVTIDLSSGVNKLPVPSFFIQICMEEIKRQAFIKEYAEGAGLELLVESLKLFEKINAGIRPAYIDKSRFANNLCVTTGASTAIIHLIEFLSIKCRNYKFFFIGYNYFLFFQTMKRYGLDYEIIVSKKKDSIAPSVEEIITRLNQENASVIIFITMPFNPSGEGYSKEEFATLVKYISNKGDSMLILDKCQVDEINNPPYEYIGRVIIEENLEERAVVLNSLSKTRSIAGLRIGYMYGNKEAVEYSILKAKYSYYCAPQIFIMSIVLDMVLRNMFIYNDSEGEKKMILIAYEKLIKKNTRLEFYLMSGRSMLKRMNDIYLSYIEEVRSNYKLIDSIYKYMEFKLKRWILEKTLRRGGLNCCIKLCGTSTLRQVEFCQEIADKLGVLIMPECYFNGSVIRQSEEPFWIRITLSIPGEQFCIGIDHLAQYLNRRDIVDFDKGFIE